MFIGSVDKIIGGVCYIGKFGVEKLLQFYLCYIGNSNLMNCGFILKWGFFGFF